MASGALRDYFGRGPIASRPATPDLYGDVLGFWFATDTGILSAWNGAGWEDVGSVNPLIVAPPSGGFIDGAMLMYSAALGAWVEIPPGTPGQVLTQQSGPTADWEDPTGGGAVSSVNGQTGAVVLSLFDLSDVLPNTGAPDDGDVLTWSAAQNAWIAQPGGSGTGNAFAVHAQVLQSKKYLMRDGTFRDPLRVGLGTLTLGSASTVANDSTYLSWPHVCRMQTGDLLLMYTTGAAHGGDNTGNVVGKIGVESPDGTITWGAQFTIADHASERCSGVGVASLASGRVVCTYLRYNYPSNPLDGAYLVYSDDFGVIWSAEVTINSSLSSFSYGSSPVVQLPNGDCLAAVEGQNSGDTHNRMVLLRSTDDCETWGSQVTLANNQGTRNYYEAHVALLDDGSLLALLRTTDGDGDIYKSTSTDDGATWSAPAVAFAGHAQPHFIQASTGTLIAVTRKNEGAGIGDAIAYTSIDRGATWSSLFDLDTATYEMEYGAPIELLDQRLLVLYGDQPSSALTNADIKQVYVTEAVKNLAATSRVGMPFEKEIALSDLTTALTTGVTKGYWRPAFAATGVSARLSLRVASSSGLPTVDMNKNGATMMSTKLSIDVSELTSLTAATPVVMSTTTFAIDDLIEFDQDVAGTGAMGAIVTVTGLYA